MTISHSPHTAGRAESQYDATKNDATIIAVWRHGQSDTMELARRFHITEAHAYHIIANRPAKTPVSGLIRYAGKVQP